MPENYIDVEKVRNFLEKKHVYKIPDKGGAGVEEKDLIRESKQGNMAAFEQLLLQNEKKVYAIAFKYMGNHEDASDIAQEAFLKAYQSIKNFRGESSFGTWVGRITANKCLDELRRRQKVKMSSLDSEVELEEGSIKKEIASDIGTPEDYAIRQETVEYVQKMIGQMKDEYRIVLVLRELEGHSYDEIASMLSCSLGTVKSRISRAREYLKERILAEKNRRGE